MSPEALKFSDSKSIKVGRYLILLTKDRVMYGRW